MPPNRIPLINTIQWAFSSQIRAFVSLFSLKKRLGLFASWGKIDKPSRTSVVVIGGGPSFTPEIRHHIIANREKVSVTAINFFCLADKSKNLVPDYYVLSDPVHLQTDSAEIEANNQKLKDYIKRQKPKLITPYGKGWDAYAEPFLQFDDRENLFSANIDPRFPRGYPSNTMFKAIAIILAIGYKNIYLVGFDYDYPRKILLDAENNIYVKRDFHYGSKTHDYSQIFDSVGHALHHWALDYWHLRKLSTPRITNVTESSMVDAFQRMSPSDFIKMLEGMEKE